MLLANKRIFIVEDNLANRASAQMLLERNGARTAIERYSTNTLERLKAFAPVDIILIDLTQLEDKNGFDITDEIRKIPGFAQTPVVAVAANDPANAIPKARAKGFAGFISKPIDFDLFPQQVARILSGEKLWCEED